MTEEAARIQSLIEELNHTKWSSMTSFLQKNEAMIMRGSAAYQKYLTLTEKQKNAVNQIVVDSLPVDSFRGFPELRLPRLCRNMKMRTMAAASQAAEAAAPADTVAEAPQ